MKTYLMISSAKWGVNVKNFKVQIPVAPFANIV